MRNSKYVTSWFVEILPNGIYHALFNLTERGLQYHAYNDKMFEFENIHTTDNWNDIIQEIPEFLPNDENITYLRASAMNKDQCSFYWIPYKHEWIKESGKIITEGKNV